MREKIVVVKRRTRLEELVERHNTIGQARFTISRAGGNFDDYANEHETYLRSLDSLVKQLPSGIKYQIIDRSFVPNYIFTDKDVVVTVGQDGLVANTAKYLTNQPLIALNPDPARFDGILLPFVVAEFSTLIFSVLEERAEIKSITLAEAKLNDGQRLLAFNDLFVGANSHVSARYRIKHRLSEENQSSSGVIISTGAGSSGWLSSIFRSASAISNFRGAEHVEALRFDWDDSRLLFAVREPFTSKHSSSEIVMGFIEPNTELVIESQMPKGGVIFSDGIEADFLNFNSGSTVTISKAEHSIQLVAKHQSSNPSSRNLNKSLSEGHRERAAKVSENSRPSRGVLGKML